MTHDDEPLSPWSAPLLGPAVAELLPLIQDLRMAAMGYFRATRRQPPDADQVSGACAELVRAAEAVGATLDLFSDACDPISAFVTSPVMEEAAAILTLCRRYFADRDTVFLTEAALDYVQTVIQVAIAAAQEE